jgi:hypothetical protein
MQARRLVRQEFDSHCCYGAMIWCKTTTATEIIVTESYARGSMAPARFGKSITKSSRYELTSTTITFDCDLTTGHDCTKSSIHRKR